MEADAALGLALRKMAAGDMTESGDLMGGTWDDPAYVAGARKILGRLEKGEAVCRCGKSVYDHHASPFGEKLRWPCKESGCADFQEAR